MYYPKELFHIREDITRENKRKYDRYLDEQYTAIQEYEQALGRKMTTRERWQFKSEYENAHRFW